MELSEEEIQRRKDNANSLVAQGRLGGAEFGRMGGRPRKIRASEKVAEKVQNDAEEMYIRFREIMDAGVDRDSITAMQTLLKIEDNERVIQEREEVKVEQLRRDELLAILTGTLSELVESGILVEGIVEGEFVELIDREIEAPGSDD